MNESVVAQLDSAFFSSRGGNSLMTLFDQYRYLKKNRRRRCLKKLLKDSTSSNQMSPSPKYAVFLTFSVRRKQNLVLFWLHRLRVRQIMVPCFHSNEEFKPQPPSGMFLLAQRFEFFCDLAAI